MISLPSLLRRLVMLVAAALVAGCGGDGGGSAPAPAAFAGATAVRIGVRPATVTLPVSGGITGTMTFPAVSAGAVLQLSASASAPAGVTPQARNRAQAAATLSVYEYLTIVPSATVMLPSIPAFTLFMPAQIPAAGKSFFYAISTPDPANPPASFSAHGPATLDGQTVAFAAAATPLTLVAGRRYVFMVYATYAAAASSGPRIYVAGLDSSVHVYNSDGTQAFAFDVGFGEFTGVAINAAGKIYITNSSNGTVATYTPQGKRTTPTITGLSYPTGIAVGAAGRIYVVNGCCVSPSNTETFAITSYLPDGTPAGPAITTGLNRPDAIAVDPSGKMYVVNGCCQNVEDPAQSTWGLRTYTPAGEPATPTIVADPNSFPAAVAVDPNGKIYVDNDYNLPFRTTVTTFAPDGTPTMPTIVTSLISPRQIAVDAAGKIYIGSSTLLTTYLPDGSPTVPTIVFPQYSSPSAIAVH